MDDDFPVKVYADEIFEVACIDTQGREYKVITQAHDPFVSRIRRLRIGEGRIQAGRGDTRKPYR